MGSSPACHRSAVGLWVAVQLVAEMAGWPQFLALFSSEQHRCEHFAKEHFFQSPFIGKRISVQTIKVV